MKKVRFILAVIGFTALVVACTRSEDDPNPSDFNPTPYELLNPFWFPNPAEMKNNPLTEEGVYLGRKLYYDNQLSKNGDRACATCHLQKISFTNNQPGTSVLAHVNLAWSNVFLWGSGVEGDLVDIMLFEVEDFFETDVQVLQSDSIYPELFNNAFGSRSINTEMCAKALAQFVYTLMSYNSRFDLFASATGTLTEEEMAGFSIFMSEKGDCFHCHIPPLFTDNNFHNVGLDSVFEGFNLGRYLITGKNIDKGVFKTPGLRNVALTAPYMHDGRFTTLEEVINHYDHGVNLTASTDPIMGKNGKGNGLGLSSIEKEQLLAFLESLTDTSFLSNPSFSKP